jgi:signal peptidase II
VLGLVALAVSVADQVVKFEIVHSLKPGEQRPFLGEILSLHYVANSGAAFSLGTGFTWIFAIVATLVVVFIIVFAHRIRSFAWASVFGLLLGGTAGNLADRFFREPGFGIGHVIDFLQLWGFPAIFNIADAAIVSSMAIFIVLSIRGIALDGKRTTRGDRSDSVDELES